MKLLTYNVKLLPVGAKLFEPPFLRPWGFWERGPGGVPDHARTSAIGALVAAGPWDVVCLSEVFDASRRKQLEEALRPTHRCLGRLGAWRLADSGLFFASRLPILTHRFHRFSAASGADRLAAKGIVHAVLDGSRKDPRVPFVHVFATHLQAFEDGAVARAQQLAEARGLITRCLADASSEEGHAAVLLGDLNIPGEHSLSLAPTPEHRAMCELFDGARDLFRELRPARAGCTWDGVQNFFMTGNRDVERLDYV